HPRRGVPDLIRGAEGRGPRHHPDSLPLAQEFTLGRFARTRGALGRERQTLYPGDMIPTTQPVMPDAIVPETSARRASSTISCRRSGTIPETPAIMIPTEPKLAKPHRA